MALRDYIVQGGTDYLEETHTRKRDAIRAAKKMARVTNGNAYVTPCIDGCPNDFAPYYVVTPKGEIIEK